MSGIRLAITQWGKDHWSTLAYAEARCVDHKGVLHNAHMRTHGSRHPLLMARGFGTAGDGSQYPTIHKDGELADHDDWDCLHDLALAGLLNIIRPHEDALWIVPVGSRGPIKHLGNLQTKALMVMVSLTELGFQVAGDLREHMAKEHKYQKFQLAGVAQGQMLRVLRETNRATSR